MMVYDPTKWDIFTPEEITICGNPFGHAEIVTADQTRIALGRNLPAGDDSGIVSVNGRPALPKRWWRRNVAVILRVGDTIVLSTLSGNVTTTVAEIRMIFHREDLG